MRARDVLILAVLASAACGPGSPLSSGPACPRNPEFDQTAPAVVVSSGAATVLRHDVSLEGLAHLPGAEALGPGGKLQGLTVVHHQLSYKTGIALTHPLFGGPRCAWVDKLTVDMTPEKMEIYIPSDYPEGSCEYDQILSHERQHEETHRDALRTAVDEMRLALAQATGLPARGTPIQVADRPEAERRIEEIVDKAAKPVYARFKDELKRRQAVIDLPENYLWTQNRCRDWKQP
ncbi:MAG TPA: hypothetical protein VN915_11875 [Elusimicrobiota bacterium]|nr:hypothetical protein [Elusimicrobiota bacterium]